MKVHSHMTDAKGLSIFELDNRNFIMAGYAKGSFAAASPMLMKLDENGDPIWTRIYDTQGVSKVYEVIELPGQGFLLTGYITISDVSRILIIKTDQDGQLTDSISLGNGTGFSVTHAGGDKYAIGAENKLPGEYYRHFCFIEIDRSLNVLKNKMHLFNDASRCRSIKATSDGGYISVGYTGYDSFGTLNMLGLTTKLDESGEVEWYEEDFHTQGYEVEEVEGDGYYITGTDIFWNISAFFSKRDFNGNKVWDKSAGFSGYSHSLAISDDKLTCVGSASIIGQYWYAMSLGNINGDFQQIYYGLGEDIDVRAYSVSTCSDKGFIACGQSNSDVMVIKTTQQGELLSVNELYKDDKRITVFPNPSSNYISINLGQIDLSHDSKLLLCNARGSVVYETVIDTKDEVITCDVSNLTNGLYTVLLRSSGIVIASKKFIKAGN